MVLEFVAVVGFVEVVAFVAFVGFVAFVVLVFAVFRFVTFVIVAGYGERFVGSVHVDEGVCTIGEEIGRTGEGKGLSGCTG